MVKGVLTNAWQSLWSVHAQTKKLLTFSQIRQAGQAAAAKQQSSASAVGGSPGGPSGSDKNPEKEERPAYTKAQLVGLILGPLLFVMTLLFFNPDGLSADAKAVLASTLWIATWWITEAIPIPATSLLPIILLPVTGALDSDTVFSAYGDNIIFLFLGGFFIATAMEKWNLHKRIALNIISLIGTSTKKIILGFMIASGFLSMWVSNTAAVMMMIPIGLAITYQVSAAVKEEKYKKEIPKFEKAIIFGIGYAGTIGGLGTLIGTPPNSILAGTVNELYNVEISFAGWMAFAVPIVFILLISAWVYLTRIIYPIDMKHLPGGRELIQEEKRAIGMMSWEEKLVLSVFLFAAFMWITRTFIWEDIVGVPGIGDGMIAMTATVLLFLLPAKQADSTKLLEWKDSRDIPWGILLLFGGGLAIAAGFSQTGLSNWIGEQLTVLEGMNFLLIVLVSTAVVLFLTEITSNTATGTMILPVVASLAIALNVHPYALMVPCAMAANCAFMLPVGTPPNAIIFGTGKLKIIQMVQNGFALNILAIILITLAVTFYLPAIWGIDLQHIPSQFL
ncbi:solute carrier family 13 (sodium-dependent dicarboxylate transporter), member 2/3/5 [Alteribacillus persepolensis]|uniref:Sodium-dependent dicarboxylate transporter SdcS n=1 Tax=Alteribacillus persepolensis TaxID=568899 RepID=A0A1G8AA90_9BACI|nr:DASS family sodium-coupled anion symporter [Alteribacillus persepolensis]SDH17773.1 solute carrier family 13 (sodium-dependent dicarboxylate transporter), member 2/3/5 [Alteribacillus persepolensis]